MADPTPPNEMLAGLLDIRLPETAPGGVLAELAAAVGAGLLIACVLGFLVPVLTRKVPPKAAPRLSEQIEASRRLPEAERSVMLLHLLRSRDRDAADALQGRLYARGAFPAAQELEQRLLAVGHADA